MSAGRRATADDGSDHSWPCIDCIDTTLRCSDCENDKVCMTTPQSCISCAEVLCLDIQAIAPSHSERGLSIEIPPFLQQSRAWRDSPDEDYNSSDEYYENETDFTYDYEPAGVPSKKTHLASEPEYLQDNLKAIEVTRVTTITVKPSAITQFVAKTTTVTKSVKLADSRAPTSSVTKKSEHVRETLNMITSSQFSTADTYTNINNDISHTTTEKPMTTSISMSAPSQSVVQDEGTLSLTTNTLEKNNALLMKQRSDTGNKIAIVSAVSAVFGGLLAIFFVACCAYFLRRMFLKKTLKDEEQNAGTSGASKPKPKKRVVFLRGRESSKKQNSSRHSSSTFKSIVHRISARSNHSHLDTTPGIVVPDIERQAQHLEGDGTQGAGENWNQQIPAPVSNDSGIGFRSPTSLSATINHRMSPSLQNLKENSIPCLASASKSSPVGQDDMAANHYRIESARASIVSISVPDEASIHKNSSWSIMSDSTKNAWLAVQNDQRDSSYTTGRSADSIRDSPAVLSAPIPARTANADVKMDKMEKMWPKVGMQLQTADPSSPLGVPYASTKQGQLPETDGDPSDDEQKNDPSFKSLSFIPRLPSLSHSIDIIYSPWQRTRQSWSSRASLSSNRRKPQSITSSHYEKSLNASLSDINERQATNIIFEQRESASGDNILRTKLPPVTPSPTNKDFFPNPDFSLNDANNSLLTSTAGSAFSPTVLSSPILPRLPSSGKSEIRPLKSSRSRLQQSDHQTVPDTPPRSDLRTPIDSFQYPILGDDGSITMVSEGYVRQ